MSVFYVNGCRGLNLERIYGLFQATKRTVHNKGIGVHIKLVSVKWHLTGYLTNQFYGCSFLFHDLVDVINLIFSYLLLVWQPKVLKKYFGHQNGKQSSSLSLLSLSPVV